MALLLLNGPAAMRNFAILSGLLVIAACDSGPGALPTPPVLHVTSPSRGTIQDHAGNVTVTGTVTPNEEGVAVHKVQVNGVDAVVSDSGDFQATVQVAAGATLLQTSAVDDKGGTATDTRVIEAGELRAPGANIERGITAAISKPAFHKIGGIASDLIKKQDFNSLLAPMQPMIHSGDPNGPDCLYAQGFVDDLSFDDAKIDLVPVPGGLQFSAEIDNLYVPGHANFAVACIDGSDDFSLAAEKIVVTGQLTMTPNRDGSGGFTTTLDNPNVDITGFNLDAGGLAGDVIDMLDLDNAIGGIVASAAEKFMGPMMDKALASLPSSQQLNVLGQTIDLAVHPASINFDDNGGVIALDTSFLIEGAENSGGFIYTDNGMPNMDPGQGLELGLADDLANEALAQITALNVLNLGMPIAGGTFDNIKVAATVPPMISADPADGQMRLILGDMKVTFLQGETPVGEAMLNAKIDLSIAEAPGGNQVAIQLGTPEIFIDVTDGVANATHLDNGDLEKAVKLSLDNQITTISALLGSIPLPAIAGISLTHVSVGADDGYVMVKGQL